MLCPSCKTDNPADAAFCEQCGSKLELVCPLCKATVSAGARFCKKCGAALGASAVTSPKKSDDSRIRIADTSASENIEGERKTVTALFADIKGSTELMAELDPEEARAIIDPALKLMIDAVQRYDGYVVQSTGDGIFALFGAPVAHEDHPQRALYAALRMQEALGEQADRLAAQRKPIVEARVGINTGEVVMRTVHTAGHTEYTPVGHAANLAARMQSVAPAGGIVISEDTRRLVEGYFELRELGATEVKGVGAPLNVYQVAGLGSLRTHFQLSARRGLTRFVGREREMAELRRALELARGGRGQLIAVVAEAGTGKSRLFHEFKATLPCECKLLEACSVSHGKASAWSPVLELLRGYFGIEGTDEPAARRAKVSERLATLEPALLETEPYLFGLLGIVVGVDPLAPIDAQIRRQRTLEALKHIILCESLLQPVVVILEDLHWIDIETQALLDMLTDSIVSSRVLLLVNYRPEYRHEWANRSHYSQLRLDALSSESADAMLSALLGDSVELTPLKRLIIERTEGNPFFMEEMYQALIEQGVLVRNGTVRLGKLLGAIRVPPTVQAILASRIDRLPGGRKELLQTLAVIGRELPLGLIREVASSSDTALERMLADLSAGEFVYEQPALPQVEYVFKHALTQEVAYNSLLIERRKMLHERVGQALESVFCDRVDDHLNELAHHYSRSDNLTKAVEYLGRAGQQALQRSAYSDAIGKLHAAIDLLQKLPSSTEQLRRELQLQLELAQALIGIKGWAAADTEMAYGRVRELAELVSEHHELASGLWGLWVVNLVQGKLPRARELAEELKQIAERTQEPGLSVQGYLALGPTLTWLGDVTAAGRCFEQAMVLYDPQDHRSVARPYGGLDPRLFCLGYWLWTVWHQGYPDKALQLSQEALALAQASSDPHSQAFALVFTAYLHQCRREEEQAEERLESLISISAKYGFPNYLAWAAILRGWTLSERGRRSEGISKMHEGLTALEATGEKTSSAYHLTLLAEQCHKAGKREQALQFLEMASELVESKGIRLYEAEVSRLSGALLLATDSDRAERCFRRAIDVARGQGTKSSQLRATTSLARLLCDTGRRDEARTMLAEIYNWFTEGFDTADLKDAKALLDELSN